MKNTYPATKRCCECKEEKSVELFHKNSAKKDGRHPRCKVCHAQYESSPSRKKAKQQYASSERGKNVRVKHRLSQKCKDTTTKYRLATKYGLTLDQYTAAYTAQNGMCKICNTKFESLAVDHDHITNRVRGLLCIQCNLILGNARDNITTLVNAIQYLTEAEGYNA